MVYTVSINTLTHQEAQMANKKLFSTYSTKTADTTNDSGGKAYAMEAEEALAQLACTGCFGDTFYVKAEVQLARVVEETKAVSDEYLAKLAVYSRSKGYMKDMPALLCAILSTRDKELFKLVFNTVIDNVKMLRNFVQIMRSGVVGRKSLGSLPKKLIQRWLESKDDTYLFRNSIGNDPSLADVIKMVHPRPKNRTRENLYAYLLGKEYDFNLLNHEIQHFEEFKRDLKTGTSDKALPVVPMQLLTALPLTNEHWKELATSSTWTTKRINLQTFRRHHVFEDQGVVDRLAADLANAELISRSRAFPYQLLMAYKMSSDIPSKLQNALQDAMEVATQNVESFDGNVVVCPDVSGSMRSPVTGYRYGATSAVQCIDVAGLVASTILRQNENATVLPFDRDVVDVTLNPRDSVMTNARTLASIRGGATTIAAPLRRLNEQNAKVDLVIFVSDNESWADRSRGSGTAMMEQWRTLKRRNPKAKLVCIDVVPNLSKQVYDDKDILHVGGFSDNVFEVINNFVKNDGNGWVDVIKSVNLG